MYGVLAIPQGSYALYTLLVAVFIFSSRQTLISGSSLQFSNHMEKSRDRFQLWFPLFLELYFVFLLAVDNTFRLLEYFFQNPVFRFGV